MKKIIGVLLFLSLALVSCNSESTFYRFSVTPFLNGYEDEIKVDYSSGREFITPFNTSTSVSLYGVNSQQGSEIESTFNRQIKYYHALFDGHYDYTKQNIKINNLKTINDSYGTSRPVEVDEVLYTTLKESLEFSSKISNKFNIALGELSSLNNEAIKSSYEEKDYLAKEKEAGYNFGHDIDLAKKNKALLCTPSISELENILIFNDENNSVVFNSFSPCQDKVTLTLGGVGKGRALDLLAGDIGDYNAVINSGTSSLKLQGNRDDRLPWKILLANPLYYSRSPYLKENLYNSEEVVLEFAGNDYNLSTSGFYQQYYFTAEEKLISHIIDPSSGLSNETFLAVSVLSKSSFYSDILSTTLSLCHSYDAAKEIVDDFNRLYLDDVKTIFMNEQNGGVEITSTFETIKLLSERELASLAEQIFPLITTVK